MILNKTLSVWIEVGIEKDNKSKKCCEISLSNYFFFDILVFPITFLLLLQKIKILNSNGNSFDRRTLPHIEPTYSTNSDKLSPLYVQ